MQNCKFEIGIKKQSWLGEVHKGDEGLHWTVVSSKKKKEEEEEEKKKKKKKKKDEKEEEKEKKKDDSNNNNNNNNNNNIFLGKLWVPNTEHRWNGNWQQ